MESSQLTLDDDEVLLNMESGRNNFEMFMLVGFASAGQAIATKTDGTFKCLFARLSSGYCRCANIKG